MEYVYGFFINDGDGKQMLFEYGVFKKEEDARKEAEKIGFGSGVWIDSIELK